MMVFYWDEWNRDHVKSHGVSHAEAMYVVRTATAPFPEDVGNDKYRVWGATRSGRLIQVVIAFTSPDRMDYEQMSYENIVQLESGAGPYVYIVHARDLTASEKRRLARRRR